MNTFHRTSILLAAMLTVAEQARPAPVQYGLAVHSEEPSGSVTPNFKSPLTPKSTYLNWRSAILNFASLAQSYGIKWSFQSDWNFLEGIRRFEVPGMAEYDASLLFTAADGVTKLNLAQHLAYNLGVELDPHSHENGVNYADVDWLIRTGLNAPSSPVVGGHVNVPGDAAFQDWEKFNRDPRGLEASQHPGHFWKPALLMGGGPALHDNETHVSGLWRPKDKDHYYESTSDPVAQPMLSSGQWFNDLHEHWKLIQRVAGGPVPGGGRLYTCGMVLNHRDMANDASYTGTKARAVLATIKAWHDAGYIQNRYYAELPALWQSAPSLSTPNIFLLPDDHVQFSLNWQDHARVSYSADRLRRILDTHEAAGVPVDVFFTTWQTDDIEAQDPALLGRLQSSAMAVQSYHVRPPKPYASSFLWGPLGGTTLTTAQKTSMVTNYESKQLNLTTGQPSATVSGGYDKLKNLMGYAPVTVGVQPDNAALATIVNGVFQNMGAGFLVNHNNPVNLGARTGTFFYRPESFDWRLIALFTSNPADPQPGTLSQALSNARTAAGASRPYFTGIKLHDNDLFAAQSWWTLVYQNPNAGSWNPNQMPAELDAAGQQSRLSFYQNLVNEVASKALTVNAINSRDLYTMLSNTVPARPIGLSRTSGDECDAGTALATLSGGGVQHGVLCTYTLTTGSGDTNNADFSISGLTLRAARRLSFESGSTRRLRVRWTDASGATGDRALTFVLNNVVTDDDDGDGATEAEESAAGTNPADPASVFRVTGVTGAAGGAITFNFPSVSGRTYRLRSSADLVTWVDEPGSAAVVTGTGALLSVTDPAPTGSRKFYSVTVTP